MPRNFVLSLGTCLAVAGISAIPAGAADQAQSASSGLRPDAGVVSGPIPHRVGALANAPSGVSEATRNERNSINSIAGGGALGARVTTMQPGALSARIADQAADRASAAAGDHSSVSASVGPVNQKNRASAPPGSSDAPPPSVIPPKSK